MKEKNEVKEYLDLLSFWREMMVVAVKMNSFLVCSLKASQSIDLINKTYLDFISDVEV